MTALKKYQRIESVGLWRASPQEQRREVVVSIGDATLVITDMSDRPLAHWSLAAVERANPGKRPAIFHPNGDSNETLELAKSEKDMIDAIEKLRRAVDRSRPKPGRLRWLGVTLSAAAVAGVAVFWLPDAMVSHAVSIVPRVKQVEIGDDLERQIARLTGTPCNNPAGQRALSILGARLGIGPLTVVPAGVSHALTLPGGRIVFNKSLVEDHEDPAVIAGFAVAERLRAQQADPLATLLEHAGLRASFQLVTTGELPEDALADYAEHTLTTPRPNLDVESTLAGFEAAGLSTKPYAYALDVTGETVLPLIEADPMSGETPQALLSDADWLRLQSICER